ncbi:MAG TPA: hypothetical protein VG146_06070 [Verrucomicrobiae bacterium]|nr:hypothetical protein [Verrucomicrobiae bacterium]
MPDKIQHGYLALPEILLAAGIRVAQQLKNGRRRRKHKRLLASISSMLVNPRPGL